VRFSSQRWRWGLCGDDIAAVLPPTLATPPRIWTAHQRRFLYPQRTAGAVAVFLVYLVHRIAHLA